MVSMTKTHDRVPLPLRGIQIFEAAARHESFTAAGQQLSISQSAVSRKISELEAILGVTLFHRAGPKVVLTDQGRVFADRVSYALNDLKRAVASVMAYPAKDVVNLSMLPSVGAKWLAPKLGQFAQDNPDINLNISATRKLVNFEADGIDCAVRYGLGDWPDLNVSWLGEETVQPVCTPMFLKKHSLSEPKDLLDLSLLHADIPEDWSAWLHFAGVKAPDALRGPRFADDTAILQAALASQGIALGRGLLIENDLETGRLVAPFPMKLKTSFSYWFVSPDESNKEVSAVRQWIIREFSRS